MDIKIRAGNIERERGEAIVIGFFEEQWRLNKLPPPFKFLKNAVSGFKASLNQVRLVPGYGKLPSKYIALVGLGRKKDFSPELARQAGGCITRSLQENGIKRFSLKPFGPAKDIDKFLKALTEGIVLSTYRFRRYKSPAGNDDIKRIEGFNIILQKGSDYKDVSLSVRQGEIIADCVNWTRELVNSPANVVTPSYLAEIARGIADEFRLRCQILSTKDMERLKMRGVLSVSKGSDQPPRFIIIEYKPARRRCANVVLAGKGITFDAGGISLKPSDKLDRMKYDKAGACAALGIILAAARLKLPFHLIGLIAACENLPSGKAYKPGDIIRLASGTTVEVTNTDAEGRLILSDILWFAKRYKPDALIDIATLTGACRVALGDVAIGMLGNDKKLMDRIKAAGERSYERVWELPLWGEYKEKIKSDIADIKNVVEGGAGVITAAAFLNRFVDGIPWAHLDIAGTAWMEEPRTYNPKGATGSGVRLVTQMLLDWDKDG